MRFLGHATVLLEMAGVRVADRPVPPAGLGPLERHGPLPHPADLERSTSSSSPTGIADHFDPASLAAIPGHPLVVVPRGLGRTVRQATGGDVAEVVEGDRLVVGPLSITALPARHWVSPGAPRAQPLGYLIEGPGRV